MIIFDIICLYDCSHHKLKNIRCVSKSSNNEYIIHSVDGFDSYAWFTMFSHLGVRNLMIVQSFSYLTELIKVVLKKCN